MDAQNHLSRTGLAKYLFDEFGEHRHRHVKVVNNEGEPQLKVNLVAPDLEGSYHIIGRLDLQQSSACAVRCSSRWLMLLPFILLNAEGTQRRRHHQQEP